MILERLEITGFGCLHDITTELHPRVTVIAGRNEFGKSTLLRAVRGALYGIDAGGQGRRRRSQRLGAVRALDPRRLRPRA